MSNGDNVNIYGVTNRALPGIVQDNTLGVARLGRYGEVMHQTIASGKQHPLADEGSYWVATNPTIDTGIAGVTASQTAADTTPTLFIRNNSTTQNLYLDYIKLQVTAAGTNGTDFRYAVKIDKGVSRYTSGGSTITPVNPNTNIGTATAPSATVKFGALTCAAATSDMRIISSGVLRTGVIKVIGDTYLFTCGGAMSATGVTGVAGTAVAQVVVSLPPIVLGPSDQLFLNEYATSQTVGASYTFDLGFWMR